MKNVPSAVLPCFTDNQVWQENEKMQRRQLDKETRKAVGCEYVEWINGTTEKTDEVCPQCGKPLVLFTTNAGKRMKNAQQPAGTAQTAWQPGVPT